MNKILILHDANTHYFAGEIASTLIRGFGNREKVTTFAEVLLSGEPLNFKITIDESYAVIIIDGKTVLHESLTSYAAEYAHKSCKSIFVYIAEPKSVRFSLLSHNCETLLFDPTPKSLFLASLKASLTLLRSKNLYL